MFWKYLGIILEGVSSCTTIEVTSVLPFWTFKIPDPLFKFSQGLIWVKILYNQDITVTISQVKVS